MRDHKTAVVEHVVAQQPVQERDDLVAEPIGLFRELSE
jgi:hypothetical protein